MSVIRCLLQKAASGLVNKKTAEKVAAEVERLKSLSATGSDLGKEIDAAQQAFDLITHRIGQKAKQTAIHANLIEQGVKRFDSGAPIKDVLKSFSFTDEANGYKNGYLGAAAEDVITHHQRMFTSMAVDVLDQLDPNRVGIFRDPGKQLEIKQDMFAALRGQGARSSDPEVRAIVDSISKLTTAGADAFEKAGGNISLRKDFMLGRSVVTEKVAKASMGQYVADSLQAFDLALVREATDGAINTVEDLARALQQDYKSILSGGVVDLADFAPKGIKSIVNSRNHHRIFHFKNAAAMQDWNAKYGNDSLYQNVVDYAQRIGKDIGILETYGPKPEAFIRSMLREAANRDPEAALKYKDSTYRHFRYVTGQWDRGLDPTADKWLKTYRNVNVAAKLGSTIKDAILMDTFGLSSVANNMRGLPALKGIEEDLKRFVSSGARDDYKQWARLGWLSESFINDSLYHLRASEAEGGHKTAAELAQGVMKYSLLNRKTSSAKGGEVKMLADVIANTTWADQNANFKAWAGAHGVTEEVYNTVRKFGTEKVPDWDIDVVSPYKLYEAGYTKEAALMGTLFTRAAEIISPTRAPEFNALTSSLERNGIAAQVGVGSLKTFMGYPASFYQNHMKVLANLPGWGNKAKYTAATAVSLTMAGVVSVMVQDVLRGRDPTLTLDTVYKAMAKANFLPVIGDFIFSGGANYSTGGLGDRVGGVLLSDASKLGKAGAYALAGKGKRSAAELQSFMEQLLPGKSLWFASLALKRTVLDQLRYLYDPDAEKYYKTRAKKAETEGQPFWWAPGQTAPDRAPNLSNITEQPFFKPEKKGK